MGDVGDCSSEPVVEAPGEERGGVKESWELESVEGERVGPIEEVDEREGLGLGAVGG